MIRIIRHEVNIFYSGTSSGLFTDTNDFDVPRSCLRLHPRTVHPTTYNLFYFSVKYTICFEAFLNINLLN